MATEAELIHDSSCVANADLSADQFFAVIMTTTPRKVDIAGAAANIYGILQNKPTAGQAADVGIFGVSKAIIGATVTAGDALETDSTGRLITQTSTHPKVAVAIESGAVNNIISVRLVPTPG